MISGKLGKSLKVKFYLIVGVDFMRNQKKCVNTQKEG